MPNAKSLSSIRIATRWSTQSNRHDRDLLGAVDPGGTYAIRVEVTGFKSETRTGIVLNVSDDLKINMTLQVGAMTDSVTVEEAPVAVELGTPASSTTIEGMQVRELALGTRNYEQLVSLMPGVTSAPTDELYIGNSSPSGTAAWRMSAANSSLSLNSFSGSWSRMMMRTMRENGG